MGYADSGHCHISKMELFAKTITVHSLTKSSILEIYLTGSPKFAPE